MQLLEIIISAVKFLLAVFVCFYIPGSITRKWLDLRRESFIDVASAVVLGISLFTLVALISGFLNAAWLRWVYVALFLFLSVRDKNLLNIPKAQKVEIIFFAVVTSIFSLTMILSGWLVDQGLRYYGVNGGDGMWHLALINEMTYAFPPQHPGVAGILLKGYHFYYDFLLAQFQSMFGISSIHLLFHFFPFVISFLWVVGLYGNALHWFQSKVAGYFAVLFGMFGGSFAFLVPLLWKQSISLDDGLGVTQPFTALVNPQFASSMVFVLFSLLFFREYLQKKSFLSLVPLVTIGIISAGFKVYAGMIVIGALGAVALVSFLFSDRKKLHLAVAFIVMAAGAWILFKRFNVAFGFLVYQPLWPPHRVMQSTLDFTQWELARQTYESYSDLFGLFKLELWAFTVFLFGNLGSRLVGLAAIVILLLKRRPIVSWQFLFFFLSLVSIAFIVPLFFIQPTAGPFNMIQMYWYFLVLISIPAAGGIGYILNRIRNRTVYIVFICIMILLTLPSFVEKVTSYTKGAGSYIDRSRYDALKALALVGKYTDTTIELPLINSNTIKELEGWFYGDSDPYIAGLGYKRAYLNEETVTFPYEDVARRMKILATMLQPMNSCSSLITSNQCSLDLKQSRMLLDQEGIHLVFSSSRFNWVLSIPGVRKIYNNDSYSLYEVLPL